MELSDPQFCKPTRPRELSTVPMMYRAQAAKMNEDTKPQIRMKRKLRRKAILERRKPPVVICCLHRGQCTLGRKGIEWYCWSISGGLGVHGRLKGMRR